MAVSMSAIKCNQAVDIVQFLKIASPFSSTFREPLTLRNGARACRFGVAETAGFVDFVRPDANFFRIGKIGIGKLTNVLVPFGPALLGEIAPLLRLVIFLRQPHFGARADRKCMGLGLFEGRERRAFSLWWTCHPP